MRWSELAPAVVPRQTLISAEISSGERTTCGVAGLTYYVDPVQGSADGRLETPLSDWLGAPVQGVPRQGATANPYDPRVKPLSAAVELAVLDALGRDTDLPVAAFFGGVCRTRLEAYASLPSFATPEEAVDCAADAATAGFRAVKFHASGAVDVDIPTIREARRRLGASIKLMWDASCAYELYSAVLIGNALSEADFLWFEAPLGDDSTAALTWLARRTSVPLVPDGMHLRSASDWARGISDGIWGALRLDVTRDSGITSALQLLRLAETLGAPCEIQSYGFPLSQYSNLQLMLATHACRFFEAPFPADALADELTTGPTVADGFVSPPTRPGLGHDVDAGVLAERCTRLAQASL